MIRFILICVLGIQGCAHAEAVPVLTQVGKLIAQYVHDTTGKKVEELRADCTNDPIVTNEDVWVLCRFWRPEDQ